MLIEKIFSIAQTGANWILWLLLILSVISLGIIFERFVTLKKIRKDSQKMQSRIKDILHSHSLNEIEEISKDRETLEGKAVSYGFRHIKENGENGLEEIFNTFSLVEKPQLESNLNFLATLGANAPFIGLLGTVLEIMRAINTIGTNQADMAGVMVGIAGALVATAVGLAVAIPAVVAYNYFQRQVKQILQGVDTVKELCLAYAKQTDKRPS